MALDFPQSPQLDEYFVAGNRAWQWNGYAWDKVDAGTAAPQPYVIAHFAEGNLNDGEVLLMHPAVILVQFPENLEGSRIYASTAPQNDAEFSWLRNGVLVGTAKILAGTTEGSYLPSAAFSFDPVQAHVLSLVAPNPADPALADLSITLVGGR